MRIIIANNYVLENKNNKILLIKDRENKELILFHNNRMTSIDIATATVDIDTNIAKYHLIIDYVKNSFIILSYNTILLNCPLNELNELFN